MAQALSQHITPNDKTLRTVKALQDAKLLSEKRAQDVTQISERYAIAVTPHMAKLIEHEHDPIAKQFLPDLREAKILPQELYDPTGDYPHAPTKALVHRHPNRVLLKPTHACEVYCRFCFRREMVGPNGDTISQSDVDEALSYIETHTEISEVILTGGDPLVLSPSRIKKIMQRLQAIPHVKWIRFHTRVPIVAPHKIDVEMAEALRGIKPVLMAIHMNHAKEMTPESGAALARLAHNGVVLLGQSVLLKGVNDTPEAIIDLFEVMMVNRIKPYYLHHPDLTAGTSHFRLSLEDGMALMNRVRAQVSGVCVPQYTLDIPGGVHKIPVSYDYMIKNHDDNKGSWVLKDPMGGTHIYQDLLEA